MHPHRYLRVTHVFAGALFLLLLILLLTSTARAQGPYGQMMYSVQYGDTLASMAGRFGVPMQSLMQVNGISPGAPYSVYVGRQMMVPYAASGYATGQYSPAYAPPAAGYGTGRSSFFVYVVQSGDTLFHIGQRFGVSLFTLARINHLFNLNFIFAGMHLIIPRANSIRPPNVYIVRPGDTLLGIAIRFHTTVSALLVRNNISNLNLIFAGMRLIIPGASSTAPYGSAAPSTSPYGSQGPSYAPPAAAPTAAPIPMPGSAMNAAVSLMNIGYHPNAITVRAGTTVMWTNNEGNAIPHTVTSGSPNAPSGAFDSGTLNPGQSFQFTFSTPGTFAYFCRIHGAAMTGTVSVTP